MHDVRWPTTNDRVVLVLTFRRVTLGSALLQTADFLEPEVPATRTLAEIPANSSEIANLWCRDRVRCFCQAWETLSHAGMFFQLTQRYERANREPARVKRDAIEPANVFE